MKSCLIVTAAVLAIIGGCQTDQGGQRSMYVPPDKSFVEWERGDTTRPAASTLQKAFDNCRDGDTIILAAGVYFALPADFVDSLCGNCLEQKTAVTATTGFVIRGKSVIVTGRHRDSTVLITGAGYGVYFEKAGTSRLTRLKVTGGRRDLDGNATDAAVVVRGSTVYIEDCALSDNDQRDSSVVVGIGGVFGREGAEIFVSRTNIVNNGWDGLALYRGASAVISDCVIKKGRGAGIGVTWDAKCVALRNQVSEYWKGIGAFGTAQVVAHNNLVFDNLGWGIIGTGESFLDAANNVVYHNGNCGIAPWSAESRGRFVNNIIAANGWRDEWVCPCVGVWNYGDLKNWTFLNNLVWNNQAGQYRDMPDVTGTGGNISVDPMFVGDGDFHLQSGSPAIDAGYKEITDADGSPSDLGIYGGTSACR